MKRMALMLWAMLACPGLCPGDAELAIGAEGTLQQPDIVGLEPRIEASGDMVVPLTDMLSLLADASGRLSGILPEKDLAGFGYAAASLSGRADTTFWRFGALGSVRGSSTGAPLVLEVGTDGEISLDLSSFTISCSPALLWQRSLADRLSAEATLQSYIAAGDSAVIRLSLEGGAGWPETGTDWFGAGSAGLTWYAAIPLSLSAEAGYRRSYSPASSAVSVEGIEVVIPNAYSYHEASLDARLSASLFRSLLLEVGIPASLRLMDHGAVWDAALQDAREWSVRLSPDVRLRMDITPLLSVRFSAGADIEMSNSPYRTGSVEYISIDALLSWE